MLNKKMKILSGMLGLVMMANGLCFAGSVGTTGAQFLKIGPGARAVAMGSAFSAVADDLNAIYWNPAGLALQKSRQASASYLQYFQGVSIGFLAYSQSISAHRTLGVGLNYLSLGAIERRTTDLDTAEGTFGANDMAFYLSYADEKLLGENLSFGANLKIIRQTIDTQAAQSYALDIGTLYRTPIKKLTASLGVYNLGSAVKFVSEGDPLPLDIRLGAAYRLSDALVVAADIDDYLNDGRIYSQLGAEYAFGKTISARAGYKLGMDSQALGGLTGFSTGLGINVWGIQLDYAFVPYGELSDTHRISLSTKF